MDTAAGTLVLAEEIARGIREHGAKGYPHEACGAILGLDGSSAREARALFPLINRRDDSPRNRFSVDAGDVRSAERFREPDHSLMIAHFGPYKTSAKYY